MMKKISAGELNKIYRYLTKIYNGNWQFRWENTPYLAQAMKLGKKEPITGHSWGAMYLWFLIKRLCPNFSSLVDPVEVYEILLNHDLGETFEGDFPLYLRVKGDKDNKDGENASMIEMTSSLPKKIRAEILSWYTQYEKEIYKSNRLEVLVAKWIDNLQGNHFALTFGSNMKDYAKVINDILKIRFVVYTNQLVKILKGLKKQKALEEIKIVALHHARAIRSVGIDFDIKKLVF